ncbi:MAG: hydrogenase accessory protein HypB [Deltaproteobacteria bacterium]|nr:hydrogenase nickel incorporation protein HypB [Deltaproteobacteria bacterium]MBW2077537.1 hydrogenase nickel incorporation protein HypB [Deltaproteobacteria bacterium]MBW2310529.1 hydrogenase nickel incorporation protein HypB [Deltaproteobacteria bacterium]RLB30176.1 MAG: hydrogenase accessory protein HypB [Deltaproteobacteria bacterium]
MEVKVVKHILEANERIAYQNRNLFDDRGIVVVNLMGSPGAGKTTLLERSIEALKESTPMAVIEGDITSSYDAERIAAHAIPTVQINTGGACHLDGNMVRDALPELALDGVRLLVVENVGNLVCPAEFNIGEHHKAMIISTTEGDDKPGKYPLMFQVSHVLILNKIDLLPHLSFDMERFKEEARKVNPKLTVIPISCTTGEGLETWFRWLEERTRGKA